LAWNRDREMETGNDKRGPEWVTVALLGKPRGIRGEMFALPYTNHSEWLEPGRTFRVWFPEATNRPPREAEIERSWTHNGKLILKLCGIDSIDEAEAIRQGELCIREDERDTLPEGEFYYDDLKGMAVVDADTGKRLGTVTGFTEGIGPGVLDIVSVGEECLSKAAREEWQVPFAEDICLEVDLQGGKVVVRLPEGLRELNLR
jgi:16S rRNA processing protein RimM